METVWIVLSQLVLLHTVTGSTVNLALRKSTSASTMQFRYSAGTAVDGNTVANGQDPSKIILTATQQPFAWWKVDLQRFVLNATVRIYFRTDDKYHRKGVKLYTSTSSFSSYPGGRLCHTVPGDPSGSDIPDVVSVPCSGRWRYLLLYTDTSNLGLGKVLDFGEVQVFEPPCDNGYYGLNCDKLCSGRKCKAPSTSSCDRLTGRCPDGCEAGWREEDCTQECRSVFYGPGCSSSCSARMCLIGSSDCNHMTGQCVGGCSPGYSGTDCKQECETGVYGPGCSLACTDRKCLDPSSKCDHVTGHCKCKRGYNGTDCKQTCPRGSFGVNCTERCGECDGVCDSYSGLCYVGCLEGYSGAWCNVTRTTAYTYEPVYFGVSSLVGAVVGTFLVVVLLCVGIIICLIRQGRLQWVKNDEDKKLDQRSRDNTQMSSIDTQPASEHAHNDYAGLNPYEMADNKEYGVIQSKIYQNV